MAPQVNIPIIYTRVNTSLSQVIPPKKTGEGGRPPNSSQEINVTPITKPDKDIKKKKRKKIIGLYT